MKASRFPICGSVGSGIRYGRIRVFKKSSRNLNQRLCTTKGRLEHKEATTDYIFAYTPAPENQPGYLFWNLRAAFIRCGEFCNHSPFSLVIAPKASSL